MNAFYVDTQVRISKQPREDGTMINRKNDGTVKMTRQRATGRPWTIGMTGDRRTLDRYVELAGEMNPKQAVADKLQELSKSKRVGTCTTYAQQGKRRFMLCFMGGVYWWVKKEPYGTSKSLQYWNRNRAVFAFNRDRITWIEFFPADQEIDDRTPPRSSLDQRNP
jgi:hypothetical protein